MSAVAKSAVAKLAVPRTVELESEIAGLEKSLANAKRRENADRSGPDLIAQNDAREVAECRARIKAVGKEIAGLVADLADTQEALKLAQRGERTTANARAFAELKQLLAVSRDQITDLEAAIDVVAEKLRTAQLGLETVEHMAASAVAVDPFWLRYKVVALAQQCLYVRTDGALGERRTLDTLDELRRSGRASLKAAAREYETLALERLRSALGVAEG
jgi:hypothetical protein